MDVELWPLDKPVPYAGNPRKNEDAVEKVAASIREFGFRQPIVVDHDGVVLVGHTRLEAARRLGLQQVPVHVALELTPAQARAYRLMDNRSHEEASWDQDLLKLELEELGRGDFDLRLSGFDEKELKRILQDVAVGLADADDVPEGVEARVRLGDLWNLGAHRLVCGDATKPGDVARLLAGAVPGICVTDPPYGVKYDPAWRNEAAAKGLLAYAARRVGEVENDDRADWTEAWALFPGDVLYAWCAAGDLMISAGQAIQQAGFEIRASVIWKKPHFPISRGHYTFQHEPCWYAVRKGATAHWLPERSMSSVWEVSLDKNVPGGHGTQKPVDVMRRPLEYHGIDEVYEPFLGSGTTLIAAEQLARRCYALEIDPHYCDVALARWETFTGEKAELLERPDA